MHAIAAMLIAVSAPTLEHCWKVDGELICWPVGEKPAPWQREYLEREGEPRLCKNDVCEPVIRQEV